MTQKEFDDFIKAVEPEKIDKIIMITFEKDDEVINCGLLNIGFSDLAVGRQELDSQLIFNLVRNNPERFKELLDGKTV